MTTASAHLSERADLVCVSTCESGGRLRKSAARRWVCTMQWSASTCVTSSWTPLDASSCVASSRRPSSSNELRVRRLDVAAVAKWIVRLRTYRDDGVCPHICPIWHCAHGRDD